MRVFLTLIFISSLFLSGCQSTPERTAIWAPSDAWWDRHTAQDVEIHLPDGRTRLLSGGDLYNARESFIQVSRHARVEATLALVDNEGINAFAWTEGGEHFVALTLDTLHQLGLDQEALGNLLGHELAHLELRHGELREIRNERANAASTILGTVAGAFIPFGGTAVDLGTKAIVNAYSRDEEREADERGMRLASIAGYSPCGMTRVGDVIKQDTPDASYSFLSTHPNTDDRIKAAQKLANDRGFGLCQ